MTRSLSAAGGQVEPGQVAPSCTQASRVAGGDAALVEAKLAKLLTCVHSFTPPTSSTRPPPPTTSTTPPVCLCIPSTSLANQWLFLGPPGYFGSAEFIKSLRRAIFEARGGGRGSKIVLEDGNSGGRPGGASSQSPPSPPAPPAQPGLLSLHLHLLHTTQASNSNFSKLEKSSR